MSSAPIVPYDPDSEIGRAVAADLTRVLVRADAAIRRRKAAEAAALAVEPSRAA